MPKESAAERRGGQLALLAAAREGQQDYRATQDAVLASVNEALAAGDLTDADRGAAALAHGCARAVDMALAGRDPYGVAAAARELREQLIRLRLDPVARGAGDNTDPLGWLTDDDDDQADAGA